MRMLTIVLERRGCICNVAMFCAIRHINSVFKARYPRGQVAKCQELAARKIVVGSRLMGRRH